MRVSLLPLFISVVAVTAGAPQVSDISCNVKYHGIERNGIELFLGIPYAQDTSGDNRFKPPRPPNLEGLSKKVPVMVWIHGGSFWGGSNVEPTTAPDGLVRQSVENGLPIIHVAMNYRLGFFGFAQSGTLKAEGSENAGLRDQRLAIEWVRDNIEQFGGDPDKITIFGQSSGGLAIGMQLLAYGGTKPLPFQQGITQSQALEPGLTGNFSKDAMSVLVDYVSCNASSLDSPETIHCLRQLDTDTLLNASITTYASDIAHNVGDIWLPAVDGDFLPAPPSQLIAQGRFGNATFMSGWTQDDLNYYTDASIVSAEDTYNFIRGYLPAMPEKSLDELLGIAVHQIYSAPVFPYDFNTTILDSILAATANISGLGVVHTSEFAYVFESLEAYNVSGFPFHPTEADYKLAKRASRSWSTFANQGVPSFSSLGGQQSMTLKGWGEAFKRSGGPNLMTIGGPHEGMSALGGANATLAVQEQKLDKRCAFLNSPEIIEALQY